MMLIVLQDKFVFNDSPKNSVFYVVCKFKITKQTTCFDVFSPASQHVKDSTRQKSISILVRVVNFSSKHSWEIYSTNTSVFKKLTTALCFRIKFTFTIYFAFSFSLSNELLLLLAPKIAVEIFCGKFYYKNAEPFHLTFH